MIGLKVDLFTPKATARNTLWSGHRQRILRPLDHHLNYLQNIWTHSLLDECLLMQSSLAAVTAVCQHAKPRHPGPKVLLNIDLVHLPNVTEIHGLRRARPTVAARWMWRSLRAQLRLLGCPPMQCIITTTNCVSTREAISGLSCMTASYGAYCKGDSPRIKSFFN
jgi:hypothetical protein